jgi:hypothetical protein
LTWDLDSATTRRIWSFATPYQLWSFVMPSPSDTMMWWAGLLLRPPPFPLLRAAAAAAAALAPLIIIPAMAATCKAPLLLWILGAFPVLVINFSHHFFKLFPQHIL